MMTNQGHEVTREAVKREIADAQARAAKLLHPDWRPSRGQRELGYGRVEAYRDGLAAKRSAERLQLVLQALDEGKSGELSDLGLAAA